jgi:hypothetical protein
MTMRYCMLNAKNAMHQCISSWTCLCATHLCGHKMQLRAHLFMKSRKFFWWAHRGRTKKLFILTSGSEWHSNPKLFVSLSTAWSNRMLRALAAVLLRATVSSLLQQLDLLAHKTVVENSAIKMRYWNATQAQRLITLFTLGPFLVVCWACLAANRYVSLSLIFFLWFLDLYTWKKALVSVLVLVCISKKIDAGWCAYITHMLRPAELCFAYMYMRVYMHSRSSQLIFLFTPSCNMHLITHANVQVRSLLSLQTAMRTHQYMHMRTYANSYYSKLQHACMYTHVLSTNCDMQVSMYMQTYACMHCQEQSWHF